MSVCVVVAFGFVNDCDTLSASGCLAGCLHVAPGPARIRRGTRVAQFLLVEAETLGTYAGDYGSGTANDAKYGTLGGRIVAAADSTAAPGQACGGALPSRRAGTPLDGARPTSLRLSPLKAAAEATRRPTPKRTTSLDRPAPPLLPGPPRDLESGGGPEPAAADAVATRKGTDGEARPGVAAGQAATALTLGQHAARTSRLTAAIVLLQVEVVGLLLWAFFVQGALRRY